MLNEKGTVIEEIYAWYNKKWNDSYVMIKEKLQGKGCHQ